MVLWCKKGALALHPSATICVLRFEAHLAGQLFFALLFTINLFAGIQGIKVLKGVECTWWRLKDSATTALSNQGGRNRAIGLYAADGKVVRKHNRNCDPKEC